MKVVFDPDFDGGAWPGPLDGRSASAGEVWAGEAGILGLLEVALGLGGPPISATRRVASLVPAVRSTEGFWSASAIVDPFATARRLLLWRDGLLLDGWRGQEISDGPRLSALAAVTRSCLPGFADRFLAVEDALTHRSADIDAVSILAPASSFPPAWRRLLAALSRHGTWIDEIPLASAPAVGDLASARGTGFCPTGDGSLQLIRPAGSLEAADSIAAWLAVQDSLAETVVISPEPVLDSALRRYGLPTTGASAASSDDALLPLVPLVLALGMDPADPQEALDLLLLPVSPIPKSIAGPLASALFQRPAVGSPAWSAAMAKGLEGIEDVERRAAVSERLENLFRTSAARGALYPAAEIKRRLALVEHWLRGRIARADETGPFEKTLSFALSTADILDRSGLVELSGAQLDRVVAEASADLPAGSPFTAEAGLLSVASPGGIGGPARRIVWWRFCRAEAVSAGSFPLTSLERSALAAAGVVLEPRGAEAARRATRWRRPLLLAREALLLVAPMRDSGGEELHPHYLWDEITASLADGSRRDLVERPAPFGPRVPTPLPRALREFPQAQLVWGVPPVRLRDVESPSSLETLLGCPLKYVLPYAGNLRPGRSGSLPEGSQLLGTVAHAVLEEVLAHSGLTPDEAAEEAVRLFDTAGPHLGAALFLPGAESERAAARQAVRDAARQIVNLARRLGVSRIEVERTLEGPFLGGTLQGRADVVFSNPAAIVDLKWGPGKHADLLKKGGAVQLALYAKLLAHEDGLSGAPPVAYFILRNARLVAQSGREFPGAEEVGGPAPDRVWAAAETATAKARDELAHGAFRSPGFDQDEKASAELSDNGLFVPASCKFCDYSAICGLALPGEDE